MIISKLDNTKLTNRDESFNHNTCIIQHEDTKYNTMTILNPSDLLGGTFLMDNNKYGKKNGEIMVINSGHRLLKLFNNIIIT